MKILSKYHCVVFIVIACCLGITVKASENLSDAKHDLLIDSQASAPKKILFVGNSFSFYNNGIHNHIASLIRANGDWKRGQNRHKLLTYSGGHIHEQLGSIASVLANDTRGFDTLVLQGHSNEAIHPKKQERFAKALNQVITQAQQHSLQAYLFMTWEYKGDLNMGKDLAAAYRAQSTRLRVPVVPVGLAFSAVNQQYPNIDLYVPDVLGANEKGEITFRDEIKHPSEAGTYLAACVFYATLFNQSPAGNPFIAGLTMRDATILQTLSWQVVQAFHSELSKH